MSYLSTADLDEFAQRLRERNDALRVMLRATMIASLRGETPTLESGVHDVGEESFGELTFGVNLAAHAREIGELRDIDAAQRRIKKKSFGYCTECGEEIGLARLRAFPTAKRCLPCQQRHEIKRSGGVDTSPSL